MKNKTNHKNQGNLILVVEDSPTQAEQLRYILEKSDYEVVVSKDGKEALELTLNLKPSLVISDIMMPLMNGYELCKRIKSDKNTNNIPVILLTSLNNSQDVIEGLVCGADNFITKPYNESYLLSQISQILQNEHLNKKQKISKDLKVSIGGKNQHIAVNEQQMFTLLISTYEAAMHKNNELIKAQDDLQKINDRLEELIEERTAELTKEITERKLAEKEVDLKNIKLEKINAEKDLMFSIIAHDLKSPFNSFLGLTNILVEEAVTLPKSELFDISKRLNDTANNLYQLLENLLEWALIQKDSIIFSPAEYSLYELISKNIEYLHEKARNKQISIVNEISPGQKILADEKMLNTIMRNLLSNAIKFTNRGGNIYINSIRKRNKEIEISVKDSGIGMSDDILNKIFMVGEKVGVNGTEGELSTGLGLILCKEFVEKHGGKIWAESEINQGSTFSFTLLEKGHHEK